MNNDDSSMEVQLQVKSPTANSTEKRRDASARLARGLRALHLVLGILGTLVSVALWLVIFLVPYDTENYIACFYLLMGEPGVFLPNLLNVGCLNVVLVTSIAFALYSAIYHLLLVGVIMFKDYVRNFAAPYYHNHYRWIFRACVIPTFYAVALHASGAREVITIFALMLLAILVEILHWIVESKITYNRQKSGDCQLVVSKRVLTAHYASLGFALVLALTQLAYLIAYVAQGLGTVPLMTWLYGPLFFAYYLLFALWWYSAMSASTVAPDSRVNAEYYWAIYDFVLLLALTALATVGAILS